MRSAVQALVLADDLTGAADTSIKLTAIGSPVYLTSVESLSSQRPWVAGAFGLGVDTASRHLSSAAASSKLRCAAPELLRLRPQLIYKKIDSCLRGNLGAEIDALLDTLEREAAVIAPALPAQGRTTVHGMQLIDGRPLAQTGFAKDPLSPVASSLVAHVLSLQSRYAIGQVALSDCADDAGLRGAIRRERERGCRLIVCDAVDQSHLDRIADLVMRSPNRFLPVGSAGLAESLVAKVSSASREAPQTIRQARRLLLVCGSASHITRTQLDALLQANPGKSRVLEPEWLINASVDERRRLAAELLADWGDGMLALSIRSPRPSDPRVTPELVAIGLDALAGVAAEIIRRGRIDAMFLTGGETADAVRRSTGGEAIELQTEILPGLVMGRWLHGVVDGMQVITKAGGFGHEHTLVELYNHLSGKAGS